MRCSHSGRAKRRPSNQRSAWARVLVKRSVERSTSSHAATRATMEKPRWPAQGKPSTDSGSSVSTATGRSTAARTRVGVCRVPTAWRAASSRLASVADSAQVRTPGAKWRRRARASSSCEPRLVPSSSCHSSTMMARSDANIAGACSFVSRTQSDSGVVMSTSGSRSRWRWRTDDEVSPVRLSTEMSASSTRSGSRRACSTSRDTARRGVT